MFPILFHWGSEPVFSYPVLLIFAFLLGLRLWIRECHKFSINVSGESLINVGIQILVVGLLGARVLFILVQWPLYANHSLRVWALWEGGLVFLGGLLAAFPLLWIQLPRLGFPSRRAGLESLAMPVTFAHSVGRLACFANGCCHGSRCDWPWAVHFTNPLSAARPLGIPLHPTQLYESLALGLLGIYMERSSHHKNPRYSNGVLYLGGYGSFRFVNEFLRGDEWRGSLGGLSTSQWISLALIGSAVFLDLRRPRDHKS